MATELDLSEYWLMQWPIVALLSSTGWLTRQIPKWIEKQDQGGPFSIVSDFSHRYLQKQFGLSAGNNLIAMYFFLYLMFIWCNSIWEFYPMQTVTYYFLASKLFLDIDLHNGIWVYFFRLAPVHPYLHLLVIFDCAKTIVQWIEVAIDAAPLKMCIMGVIFLANRGIALRCRIQDFYLPFLWRIIVVSQLDDVLMVETTIKAVTSDRFIFQIFGWFFFLCANAILFWSFANPVYKKTWMDEQNLTAITNAYLRLLRQRQQEFRRREIMRSGLLRMHLDSGGQATGSSTEYNQPVQPALQYSVPQLTSAESSEEEAEIGYRVGKHLLRPRKPFVNKFRYRNDAFELPGYNEEEDSTYVGSQVTEESDSESSEEEMSKAECDLY